ncbi:MAG: hypothetical protein COU25_02940 [Candidatus Levybacteria bacterium CG10_big_fil_rev_8_21_14_0_10_35_13]|nr:MAG: hypothetical protein COU25_02940 [Candidatus Levybacteria bacterium CG10_big_fil_rev_8_21_14_0_10_35_13]
MHKDFYASGFLYHPRSQQILLQQKNTAKNLANWSLFGGKNLKGETAEQTFKRIIDKILNLKSKQTTIHSVYSYFHKDLHKNHYIFYTKINKLEQYSPIKDAVFAWFKFSQIIKLNISEQTKQDITVAKRVIDASIRKSLGQQTLE